MKMNKFMGLPPQLRDYLETAGTAIPFIRGKWFIVDPYGATYPMEGFAPGQVVADLVTAYGLCTSGMGDGILVLSGGTGTASQTSSYLDTNLAWTKYDITVVGVAAPVGYFGRSRVSSRSRTTGAITTISFTADHTISDSASGFLTAGFEAGDVIYVDTNSDTNDGTFTISAVTAGTITTTTGSTHVTTESAATAGSTTIISYCAPMITITGENNAFYNLHFTNGGAITAALGGVSIQANRNYFKNCHFIGASNATAAAVATTQFDVEVAASEIVFDDCIFGTNSTLWAAANGHIKLGKSTTQIGQVFFNRCKVISNSATSGHGAVFVTDAATLNGWIQFDGCSFVNWQSGAITALTTAVVYAATPANCGIFISPTCGMVGWAAWSPNNDKFVTCGAVGAAGTGGIGSTIS
jgi:hypothetical protein